MRKIKKLTATVFTLAMLWGAFFFGRLIFEISPNNNLHYIPEEASFVARIDGRQLFEKGIRSVVLEEDEDIVRLIEEIFERKSGTDEIKDLGIVYHSDIVFFTTIIDEQTINGFIFNLSNNKHFKDNIGSVINKNQTFAYHNNVGIILGFTEESKRMSIADLQIQADIILKEESSFDFSRIEMDDKVAFKSWSSRGLMAEGEAISGTDLSFYVDDTEIKIKGKVELKKQAIATETRTLKPSHTHISSVVISEALNDSINSFLTDLGLMEAEVSAISLNYQGTEIVEEPSFFIVPLIDLLITTSNPYDLQSSLDSLALYEEDIELLSNHFKYGGKSFYFEQISDNQFYIGVTKKPVFIDRKKDVLFEVNGSLAPLTSFYGKGMMRRFLELIPIYSASKDLTLKIDKANIRLLASDNNSGNIEGNVRFKKENFALNALVHFAIEGHIIK